MEITSITGVIAAISKSTNTTAQTSGTVFAATILDSLMSDNWDNSNGDVATDLYVGSSIRKTIDGFTQKTNVVVNNPNNIATIVRTVSTYETAFGTLTIRRHRYVQQAADATARVLGLNRDKIKLAYLDMPMVDSELSRGGAYTPKAVYGSLTVEVRNQDNNFFASGYLK